MNTFLKVASAFWGIGWEGIMLIILIIAVLSLPGLIILAISGGVLAFRARSKKKPPEKSAVE